jgi:predicted ATPase
LNPSLWLDSEGPKDLKILWRDSERTLYRGSRVDSNDRRISVLIVLPPSNLAPTIVRDRLAHEYGLRDVLDSTWAARPIELARDGAQATLVLEDPGGELLERLLDTPMDTRRFLCLAIDVAAALAKAHRRGLIHKDVKPSNILVDCADGGARLTGFGGASRLPREKQAAEPPEITSSALAYVAPEQTGRMNRSIDSRSDLYALGVTFYRMLVGALPFGGADAMERVHCDVASQPTPPANRAPDVARPLSDIVMKLLAKSVESRYQTADGLGRDLRLCLEQWDRQGHIDAFPLGERDVPHRLAIPEKLYGREREVEALLAAFNRVAAGGRAELLLVAGYSGVGKSSVVNELHKALLPSRGLFVSGKVDQQQRAAPYATLAQALQGLVRWLLSKSNAEFSRWREALREALDPNGRLVSDLVPDLVLVIGAQPPAPDLDPSQTKGRFQSVLRRFIEMFAAPERPLALFLDDLQWLDAASLDFVEDILTQSDLHGLLLIGAYRDNEVDDAHPLKLKLSAIRQAGGQVSEIRLDPLAAADVRQLVADALDTTPEEAAPLAEVVQAKTAGNPLFALQYLYTLVDDGLVAFDAQASRWSWNLERVVAKAHAENILDLMIDKLGRLPEENKEALGRLACLGAAAAVSTLALALERSADEVHAALWESVRLELVERSPDAYRFVHDRVQEAAYSLVPEETRAETHLRIGEALLAHTPANGREEAIFEIVGQLNRGARLIGRSDERVRLAELNLIAGRRAKSSAAHAEALNYLAAAAALLPNDAWDRCHDLAFNIELNRAECEFVIGALSQAERRLVEVWRRAGTAVEQAATACLSIDLTTTLGQTSRALAAGLDYLRRRLGGAWARHPSDDEARRQYDWITAQLAERGLDTLIDAPLMSDPSSNATIDVLTRLVSAVWHIDANLACVAICQAIKLSLDQGISDGSCAHFVWLGCVAGSRFGDGEAAFRYGTLGCDLVERRDLRRFEARTYYLFDAHVIPWTRHLRNGRRRLRRALEVAEKSGDVTFAGYCHVSLTSNLSASGEPLVEVQRQAEVGLLAAQRAGFEFVIDFLNGHLGLIRTLRGLTPTFGSFDGAGFDQLELEKRFASNPNLTLAEISYRIRQLQARFFAGDYGGAIAASSAAQKLPWAAVSQFVETADHRFYAALAHAAAWDLSNAEGRAAHLEALVDHHRQLQTWAENCPENFDDRAALVAAEIARIEGRHLDAQSLYERAIQSARDNGFLHNEALAYETAAHFYSARGSDEFALLYLKNARDCYLRWGADGKVRQLDKAYQHLRPEEPPPAP